MKISKDKVCVTSMVGNIREAKLRWFEHVKSRSVRERLALTGIKSGRGRIKKYWGR